MSNDDLEELAELRWQMKVLDSGLRRALGILEHPERTAPVGEVRDLRELVNNLAKDRARRRDNAG